MVSLLTAVNDSQQTSEVFETSEACCFPGLPLVEEGKTRYPLTCEQMVRSSAFKHRFFFCGGTRSVPATTARAKPVKKVAVIPTLLTLGNAVCGFAAIAWASKIGATSDDRLYMALSGWLIIGAMIFDALDGYVARLARTASKFGGELDSLCDAISFGVAPAFLLLKMGPGWDSPQSHRLLAGIAALYMVCALLRLARFNVENTPDPNSHKRFRGLPSPGAAGCLASLAILRGEALQKYGVDDKTMQWFIEWWATLGALVVALLMVSRVPYPHVTKQVLRGRRHFSHLVQVILAGFVIMLAREVALVLLFWVYGLSFPIRYQIVRSLRGPRPVAAGLDDPSSRTHVHRAG
jgi:CDP-diacylglycerol--serine O-phosphatidyltransferase